MHPSVDVQLWRLAVLFLLGIGCCILFQIYTAFRRVVSPSKFAAHIFDGFVAVIVLLFTALTVFVVNYGELRLYIFLASAAGFLFANLLIGKLLYEISSLCMGLITKFIKHVIRTTAAALRIFETKVLTPLVNIFKKPPCHINGNGKHEN